MRNTYNTLILEIQNLPITGIKLIKKYQKNFSRSRYNLFLPVLEIQLFFLSKRRFDFNLRNFFISQIFMRVQRKFVYSLLKKIFKTFKISKKSEIITKINKTTFFLFK